MALPYQMMEIMTALGTGRDTVKLSKHEENLIEDVKKFLKKNEGPIWPDEDIYTTLKEVSPAYNVLAAGLRILDGTCSNQLDLTV